MQNTDKNVRDINVLIRVFTFPLQWSFLFFCLDALSDAIYLLDMFVQFRVAYYDDGCLVRLQKIMARKSVGAYR